MNKRVYGVGINDADYKVQRSETTRYIDGKRKKKLIWICPFYSQWVNMLQRCYSDKLKTRNPTYGGVTCCEEWFMFSNFKNWMEQQDWEGKQLDKDIIVPDNKVYSPETCAFVTAVANKFVTDRGADRGLYLIGVSWNKKMEKFQAYCRNPFTKKQEHLGYFNCQNQAHEAWLMRKNELAQLVAERETDVRIIEALKKRYADHG